ncbi:hypothetical protein NKW54_12445 [Acetobacter cerevisiae]|uniref:DUF4238 domain-containing protein n=1 Tax=Acetobacter cerevisiae TaxID=178900 RepID=A0ABT1EXR5_9PROT|nr:hypothetical protein [Acetobacter cerevisiae]MCP1246745.1 hypothetical protein [Acetobacter cerevisiae]MCP1256287.1 hypothetical protein [Acetobacter cerevisiae]
MLANETRNQHFVSQTEQRLNASNPNSGHRNLRIYSFLIENRETYQLKLEKNDGHKIASNLSMLDLFSFDVLGGGPLRMNLETLFKRYEDKIEIHTHNLLEKLARRSTDIETELIDLFAAKMLNFIRNPFCIQKVLNTFPTLGRYEPTDPRLLSIYRRIVKGQKPHQTHLCQQLGVSHETYIEWLRVIFVLLMQIGDDRSNLFEGMIKGLFEDRDTQASILVWTYDQDVCLLSDRSFCQRIPNDTHMTMSFNLCSTAFVDYIFADAATVIKGLVPPEFVADALTAWQQAPEPSINISVTKNYRPMLAQFNRRIVEQAQDRVYCAKKTGIVLE